MPGPAGGLATIKARAETTGGHFTLLENDVAPNQGPPLHRHLNEDEMFYVLHGDLRYVLGEDTVDARTGTFVFIPRGTPHCFRNTGPAPARLLVMFTPGGMERYFEEHAKLPPGTPDPAVLDTIARGAGMEILGPPMTVQGFNPVG
ncbi:MAG TPA: cupin domain-containing protein [Candidatus Dormibacteraeota bacterium]|jgi:mannose-6-phosphate isomerase-like protein (cupin superfamily)|nr:cupin domain-containing protein [Candidatus Dormibacteraeota bacterium]